MNKVRDAKAAAKVAPAAPAIPVLPKAERYGPGSLLSQQIAREKARFLGRGPIENAYRRHLAADPEREAAFNAGLRDRREAAEAAVNARLGITRTHGRDGRVATLLGYDVSRLDDRELEAVLTAAFRDGAYTFHARSRARPLADAIPAPAPAPAPAPLPAPSPSPTAAKPRFRVAAGDATGRTARAAAVRQLDRAAALSLRALKAQRTRILALGTAAPGRVADLERRILALAA